MHRWLPPAAEHCSSGVPPSLGDHSATGTAPACVTTRGEPNRGAFSAQPSPATGLSVPAETAALMVWDIPWSPHHLPLCEGRSGWESPTTSRVRPWATAGAEKALCRHWEKQTAFCTAAFQFADVHQLSLQRKGSEFFGPLGMKVPNSGDQNTILGAIV